MRDRPGVVAWWRVEVALAVATCVGTPDLCHATSGTLSVQFRRVETAVRLQRPDGTIVDSTLVTQAWTHLFGVRHSRRLGSMTNLTTSLDWADNYYIGQSSRTQSPSGRVSITNPLYGITTSYQPTRSTTALNPVVGYLPPGTTARTDVSNIDSQRLQFAGFLAMPQMPRMDVTWTRTHNSAFVFSPQQTSIARSARISHSLGPLSLGVNYSDEARGIASARVQPPNRSSWDAQAGFNLNPRPNASFGTNYTFSSLRRTVTGAGTDRNTTHAIGITGGYQPRKDTSVGLGYNFRHGAASGRSRNSRHAHDGSLSINYQPIPIASFGLNGGIRTEAVQGRPSLARSISVTSHASGLVRHGWNMDASALHSWVWDRGRNGLTSDNLSFSSRFELRRGLSVFGNGQLSTTSVARASEKIVSTSSMGVTARPFHPLGVSAMQGSYGAGPGLGRATSRSRSRTLELNLRPAPSIQLQMGLSEAGAQPDNRPRTRSQRYDLRWQTSGGMSLSTIYTRGSTEAGGLSRLGQSQESIATRLGTPLGRSVQLSAGYVVANLGARSESRLYDASVTKSFGR